MLTKKQSILMWIFILMVAIPEVLWGGIIRIFKISFIPLYNNVQMFTDHPSIAFIIIILEIVGVCGIIYIINKKNIEILKKFKYLLNTILTIVLLMLLFSLYFSYVMTKINFL